MLAADHILMVFVDGLGMAPGGPSNPITPIIAPTLHSLLAERALPLDATLGVPGRPQSATGQTTMLTGINAAALCGRHVEGFPGEPLKQIIQNENLLHKLQMRGRSCTFANAYSVNNLPEVLAMRRHSVTTVCALSALGRVRYFDELCHNRAVYQDLTRELLVERGFRVPLIRPREAARHLIQIAVAHSFTLFEFFLTDRAGHSQSPDYARAVLQKLDEFLSELLEPQNGHGITLILTSDHGNIEDLAIPTHTLNPVPWLVVGPAANRLRRGVHSLEEVTPRILNAFSKGTIR